MGHDIKRIADDEWESGNPIDFRGTQAKNAYAQRAYADFNDEDYLALGVNAMKETGDKSGQFALYNAGTDSRKALDIAHLNLDDYYGSHITGAGLPNKGSAYSYDASALKVLPKDIGKLSTNEQMDTPAQTKANYKTQRRSMGLPEIIPTLTQPSAPHEVEQEQEAPPEGGVGDPHAKPKADEADIQAGRMEQASQPSNPASLRSGISGLRGISSVAGGDAGGTVRFTKEGETKKDPFFTSRAERLERLETASGRTVETLTTVKKGTTASDIARAKASVASPKEVVEDEISEDSAEEEASVADSRAGGGGGADKAKRGHRFDTRKAELEKAFPGIKNLRSNAKEPSYGMLSTGQKKFMVAIAQGVAGTPSEDLMENYRIDQGEKTERQHDYMMKMIDAHDKRAGKKGLVGWATNLEEVGEEIPSLSLGKLFSLSPEGRDIVYQSTKASGTNWFNPKIRLLTDHDLDVLLGLYTRVRASPATATRGEKAVASGVSVNASSETLGTLRERRARLKEKGYEE
jgi:hypothetical protein